MTCSLLIYDGSRRVFRTAATAFCSGVSDLDAVPWESGAVQAFLEAQFDARPFVFALIEGETVHVGAAAVERLLRSRGTDESTVEFLKAVYPAAAAPFGRIVHGREPADIHGSYRLTEAAREHLERYRRCREIPVVER
ncbi:MAG: hypothetical protein PPP58_05430 [Natronomonas sp.]